MHPKPDASPGCESVENLILSTVAEFENYFIYLLDYFFSLALLYRDYYYYYFQLCLHKSMLAFVSLPYVLWFAMLGQWNRHFYTINLSLFSVNHFAFSDKSSSTFCYIFLISFFLQTFNSRCTNSNPVTFMNYDGCSFYDLWRLRNILIDRFFHFYFYFTSFSFLYIFTK